MKELNTAELYSKICKWLGMKFIDSDYLFWHNEKVPFEFKAIDFLHDRNQQKWIREQLKKEGWTISIIESKEYAGITIFKPPNKNHKIVYYHGINKDLNLAFLQAVEQLIENEKNKTGLTKS